MDKLTYEKLKAKLDSEEIKIVKPDGLPGGMGMIITEDTKVSNLSSEQLTLFHSMLHMFASSKNGRGLTRKTIEQLHSEVIKHIKNHKQFDELDNNEFPKN